MALDSLQFQAGLDVWYFPTQFTHAPMDSLGGLVYVPLGVAWLDTTYYTSPDATEKEMPAWYHGEHKY